MGLLPGATERKPADHLLLGAAWDELGVDESEGEGLGPVARHSGDGRKTPETSLGGEWEWMEVARIWSDEWMRRNICGIGFAPVGGQDTTWQTHSHILPGYGLDMEVAVQSRHLSRI